MTALGVRTATVAVAATLNATFGTRRAAADQRHELTEAQDTRLAATTRYTHRLILRNYLLDRWGKTPVREIKPLVVESWLRSLREGGLSNPSCERMRGIMALVFKHAQRHGLIPNSQEANPMPLVRCKTTSEYEPIVLKPEEAFSLLMQLEDPERTLTLLAAGTGLRISECLGLQWQDIDFENQRINVRRTWVRTVGEPKSKASKCPVPMHRLLAEFMSSWKKESPYSRDTDWVFPSTKLKGKKPRVANMLARDYVRPAAEKAGILRKDDERRFGFHNLRHKPGFVPGTRPGRPEDCSSTPPARERQDDPAALMLTATLPTGSTLKVKRSRPSWVSLAQRCPTEDRPDFRELGLELG